MDMKTPNLTHVDASGHARMIDVSGKPESERWAVARGSVVVARETLELIKAAELKKGDVRSLAEIAGVMGAKRTAELIPLCHPLPLTHVDVQVALAEELPGVNITATVRTTARTGVEMEALTAVAVSALTVYDMVKSVDRAARITDIRLVEKGGGTSGDVVLEQ
jgi:cyclic pyranopterin phosphate synthase